MEGLSLDIFGPQRIAVQLDEARCVEFLSYWVRYDRPVPITFQEAKTAGLVAVTFTVDPKDYKRSMSLKTCFSRETDYQFNV